MSPHFPFQIKEEEKEEDTVYFEWNTFSSAFKLPRGAMGSQWDQLQI